MDIVAAYTFLPPLHIAIYPTKLSIYTHLQPIRLGSLEKTRANQGLMACHKTYFPVPSLGWQRIRSSAMNYTDIHTHNRAAGPDAIINLDLGDEIPAEGAYSIGIHPWNTEKAGTDSDLQQLAEMAQNPRIVAIGECGLDALRGAPLMQQEEIFIEHVRLSEMLGKPLIIHAVRTHQRIIELRQMLKPTQRWIIHGFRGKPQLAQALLRSGCDISIGEKYNPAILEVVPPERLFHETD